MRSGIRRALEQFWRAADRVYERFLIRSIEIAFGLGFLVWFMVSNALARGKW